MSQIDHTEGMADSEQHVSRVREVFAGGECVLDGQDSAINKRPISVPVSVDSQGLCGDRHAGRMVHGGSDKAVHGFPLAHYSAIAEHFPPLRAISSAGVLGENLSIEDGDENDVCPGDVYRCGSVCLQITQPRRPCWKIDARLETRGVAAWMHREGRLGWYYRVLESGVLRAGDQLTLVSRESGAPNLRQIHLELCKLRPSVEMLEHLLAIDGLGQDWRQRLGSRRTWLIKKYS